MSTATLELISEITRRVDEEHAATLERNRAALESLVEQDSASELKQKVLATIKDLKEGLLEREMEVHKYTYLAACRDTHGNKAPSSQKARS